jgi:quercetin dioxygenase-like cupin family protein
MGDAMTSTTGAGLGLAALIALASVVGAQTNMVHKTTLQDLAFPPPQFHTVTIRTVVDRGGELAPHTHPGIEMGYVLDGHAVLRVTGQPPRSLAAGESFSVPPRVEHSVENVGSGALTTLSTFVVERDQPIASAAR